MLRHISRNKEPIEMLKTALSYGESTTRHLLKVENQSDYRTDPLISFFKKKKKATSV